MSAPKDSQEARQLVGSAVKKQVVLADGQTRPASGKVARVAKAGGEFQYVVT
jgi:hypothetical protein